jgi:outer membrane protein
MLDTRGLPHLPSKLQVVALAGGLMAALLVSSRSARGQDASAPSVGAPWSVSPPATPQAVTGLMLPPGTASLTLAQLTDHALRNNPATGAAWAAALADGAGIDVARAALRPSLDLNIPLSVSNSSSGAATTLSPSLGLNWVLFDFGARAAGVEAARWQAAAARLTYNRALQDVVAQVEQAYYALLGARQLEAALGLTVQAAQASLETARARRSAGLATVGDTSQAEAAWAEAQLLAVRARTDARAASGNLSAALGLPVTTALNLADDSADLPGAVSRPFDIDALLASARLSRADLAARQAAVLRGQAQVDAAQAQGRPALALSAQAARRWGSNGVDARSTQQVSLVLSIPLFDGGLARAQTAAARARLQALTAQRDQQAQNVELEVWQAYQAADAAPAVIGSAQALLQSASVAETAARERYAAGVGSVLELLLAQSTLARARVGLVQARYDARLALARLGLAIGAGGPTLTRP